MIGKTILAAGGAVAAAFVSALCCVGPLLAVAIGVSGAGLAGTFQPLRPYFVGSTVLFLGLGHYAVYREERKACQPGKICAEPAMRRRMKWLVWSATVIALVLATFPYWSAWIFR